MRTWHCETDPLVVMNIIMVKVRIFGFRLHRMEGAKTPAEHLAVIHFYLVIDFDSLMRRTSPLRAAVGALEAQAGNASARPRGSEKRLARVEA
jgi:hypothetical protein